MKPALCAWLIVAALLAGGCAEVSRVDALEQANRERDRRLAEIEKGIVALQDEVRSLTAETQKLTGDGSPAALRTADLLQRAAAELDALAKDRAEFAHQLEGVQAKLDTLRAPNPRGENAPECRWLGQRTIVVLLRDDLIAAEGFTRLYATMGCPQEHLALALGCATLQAQSGAAPNAEAQVAACWQEPRRRP